MSTIFEKDKKNQELKYESSKIMNLTKNISTRENILLRKNVNLLTLVDLLCQFW